MVGFYPFVGAIYPTDLFHCGILVVIPVGLLSDLCMGGRVTRSAPPTLPLLLPMTPSMDEALDTKLLSAVTFRGMYNPVGFNDSKLDAVEGCETATTAPPYPLQLWFLIRLRRQ